LYYVFAIAKAVELTEDTENVLYKNIEKQNFYLVFNFPYKLLPERIRSGSQFFAVL